MREFYDSFNGNKLKLVFGSLLKTVEAFFELFGEGFISLCSVFVPQKVVSEKRKII